MRLPLLALLLLGALQVRSQIAESAFELVEEKDGVSIFTGPEVGDKFTVRVVTRAGTQVQRVRQILDDADHYTDWVHRCDGARILPGGTQGNFNFVSTIDMPFPLRDREVVATVEQHLDSAGRLVRNIVAVPTLIAPTKGVERMQVYDAIWIITPQATGGVEIMCTVTTDAGAGLPTWIRKEVMTGGPVKTLVNLRNLLESK